MTTQTYANHAHRPVPTLVGALLWLMAVAGVAAGSFGYRWGSTLAWGGVLLCLLVLLSIGRLYTTALQDRIIVLEERLRATSLLSPAQLAQWSQLRPKQVAALRFASDAEYPHLFDRTLAEKLRPDSIKRAVSAWRPDTHRT